ncbi:MAG TPA: cysteine dioxygenase family protein [Candidatus Angelobacter sp.]|nr:cysteine dioxygenase family protein [Candidatus Angelobacter sp.]
MQQESYTLQEFIKDVDAIVRGYSSESEVLLHLKPASEQLVSSSGSVPAKAFAPRIDRFAMNLLQMPQDEAYSIIGGVWHPGQTTPIHDHLTWALIGVYYGEEREALFRRTDDGSNPKLARIQQVSERVKKKGQVTVLGHSGIHRVDNISLKPTTSVHIYGRDIGNAERHSYDPITGEIGRFVSGYCNVLRDTERF